MGFVCAFRGRRDSYQVPIALAEAGELDQFITDYFAGPVERAVARYLPEKVAAKLLSRYDPQLPQSKIERLPVTAAAEAVAGQVGVSAGQIYASFDRRYGCAMARYARRHESDIFAYSPYAWDAFRASYHHVPRKILFQFHPHFALENTILEADLLAAAASGISFVGQMESGALKPNDARIKGDSSWQLADHIVCASTFTQRSLVEEGADPADITVVPYGMDALLAMDATTQHRSRCFHALFVGTGLQRKGLHHLLQAWSCAHLPAGARLTVVCRSLDPSLALLLNSVSGVEFMAGVTTPQLKELYLTASLFVMPSLVEGFGQVYLEALSHGLPVLGTANTCLPDLGGELDGIFLVPPGDIECLATRLAQLADLLQGNREINGQARRCAARFSWARFRAGIQSVLHCPVKRLSASEALAGSRI